MRYAEIRAALTAAMRDACAPVRVVDEEADVVAGLTIVVCWVGCEATDEGWAHRFEERIILTGYDDAAPHFAERDGAAAKVAQTARRFADTARSWKSVRVSCAPATVTVGGKPTPALVCRHNVHEPLQID